MIQVDLNSLKYPFCLLLSLGLSLGLTPWMAATASRIGFVDRPDGDLKKHRDPVPYMGGLAVFTSFLVGFAPFYELNQEVLAILLGGTLIVLLGFLDDIGNLSAFTKLLGQSLAVLIVLKAGIAIKIVFLSPFIAYPLSFLWLLGLTNAFNLIDIMDGLSSGVGAISSLFLAILAILAGQSGVALMCLALMGSMLGFLRFNFRPARIYMGDAGSLFIGFTLGSLSMIGVYAQKNPVAVLAPVLILGVPIFDTIFVVIIRWLRGRNPFWGSPDHFALRLRQWRLSVEQTVGLSYIVSFILGIAALAMVFGTVQVAAAILGAVSILTLIAAILLKKIDMNL